MGHWSSESFFYHIYPLGFCGALYKNDLYSAPVNRLQKLCGWIDHIKSLGVNALYLGPIFESTYHGYDTADYFKVDRRLGDNDSFRHISAELHRKGFRLILDGVFNHTGRNFWAFKDVLTHRENSAYRSWFAGLDFSRNNQFNDNLSYESWNGHYDLVKLNLNNPLVKAHIFAAVKMWIEEFNIDGLRLDAADCIDISFLKELSSFTKNIRSDFWLLGEVIHGDYRNWVNPGTLDSVTNYEAYKGLYSSHNDNNYFEIAYTLKRQFAENGIYKDHALYNFSDNHDVNRITSTLKNQAHLFPLHCLLFTMPGVPSIYYGSEWALKGSKQNGNDTFLRPNLELEEMLRNENHSEHSAGLQKVINKLANIRHNSTALKSGSYKELYVSHQQLAFIRKDQQETMLIILNSSDKPVSLELNLPAEFNASGFTDLLNSSETFQLRNNKLKIEKLWPNWARILRSWN